MALPRIARIEELYDLVDEIGFLPFLSGGPAGFSLMDITPADNWWTDDAERDPWEWRKQAAASGRLVYAKLFERKAGFVSLEYFPYFANYRRDGYDFDALYDEGKARHEAMRIMRPFSGGQRLLSSELRRLSGFDRPAEKGFDGAVAALQMQTYLVISGFRRRVNRHGEAYGWPISEFATPEALFGADRVTAAYGEEPARSFERLLARAKRTMPEAGERELRRLLR